MEKALPKHWNNFGGKRGIHDQVTEFNAELQDGLYNDADPCKVLVREAPQHRLMVEMARQGFLRSEIAAYTDYSPGHVQRVLHQPWARERIITGLKEGVQDEMKKFLEGEVMPSLEVLKTIRDSEKSTHNEKIVAADKLLDRFLGKPTQPTKDETKDPSKLTNDQLERAVQEALAGVPAAQSDIEQS